MTGNTNLVDEKIDILKTIKNKAQSASVSAAASTWTDATEMTFTAEEYGHYLVFGTLNVYNSTSDGKQIALNWGTEKESIISNPVKDYKAQVAAIVTIDSSHTSIKLRGYSPTAATLAYGRIQAIRIK